MWERSVRVVFLPLLLIIIEIGEYDSQLSKEANSKLTDTQQEPMLL